MNGIEQNVLQYCFQTGSGSNLRYLHIFLRVTFLEEDFTRNIM